MVSEVIVALATSRRCAPPGPQPRPEDPGLHRHPGRRGRLHRGRGGLIRLWPALDPFPPGTPPRAEPTTPPRVAAFERGGREPPWLGVLHRRARGVPGNAGVVDRQRPRRSRHGRAPATRCHRDPLRSAGRARPLARVHPRAPLVTAAERVDALSGSDRGAVQRAARQSKADKEQAKQAKQVIRQLDRSVSGDIAAASASPRAALGSSSSAFAESDLPRVTAAQIGRELARSRSTWPAPADQPPP
jgi:hypothetical protein